MNFLTFKEKIYDWTLDTDQNLFSQVNQLTDYIFQTQQNINQSIAITRSALNESSTILNNNYNHYLRLSENKFTENKIAQPKRIDSENDKKEEIIAEPKTKMEIFKEAINISLKNLQIREEDREADNVSMSELSLSQAIFKNARLPPYFGSKEFRAQKFLNLFFDEDLGSEILSKKEIESLSNQPLSTPSQNLSSHPTNNINSGYLPPPPSLQTLNLGTNNNFLPAPPGGILPPPPPLNLLPPPPLTLTPPPPLSPGLIPPPPIGLPPPAPIPSINPSRQMITIDENDENKQLLESILVSTRALNNNGNSDSQVNNGDSEVDRNSYMQPPSLPEPPKPVENKPLTFQEELALKLKYGKDYKPPVRVIQTTKAEPVPQPKRQPQITIERTSSFRQSTKIEDIIGNASGMSNASKPLPKQSNNVPIAEDDEEEENALFGSGKRKTVSQADMQGSKFGVTKNQADIMMSRSTFNEDMLFKKKPIFSKESVLPIKTDDRPKQKEEKRPNRASMLFNQDSDEEEESFTFKKKTTKKTEQKKPEQEQAMKKSNPLGSSEKTVDLVSKKSVEEPKKKNINKLFGGDSDEQEDMFSKKKPLSKKESQTTSKTTQSPVKTAQKTSQKLIEKPAQKPQNPSTQPPKATKKNSLFNDDQEEEDFSFKPKTKPVKKYSKEEKQDKKSSLFGNDEDEDDFAFKQKNKPVQKESEKQTKEEPEVKPKIQSPQKPNTKVPLFSSIPEEQNEEGSVIFAPKKTVQSESKAPEDVQPPVEVTVEQQESQHAKRLKKIAKMGGQPMMGMAQMIPKGMNITKPSETKENEKIARQNLENQHHTQDVKSDSGKKEEIHEEPIVVPKRELDPLERLITEVITPKQPEQKTPSISQIEEIKAQKVQLKPEPVKVQVKNQESIIPASQVTLQVRRKKNKPKRKDDDFSDDNAESTSKKSVVSPLPSPPLTPQAKQVTLQKTESPRQMKKNPLTFITPEVNSEKSSQIQKIAKMSMAGMPQMGLGPLMMPKGLVITKPSEAKKLEQEALEKLKHQEAEKAQRQKKEEEETQKLKKIQIQEQQKIKRAQQQKQQKARQQQQALQRNNRQTQQALKKIQLLTEQSYSRERQQKIRLQQQQKQSQRQRLILLEKQKQGKRLIEAENERLRLKNIEDIEKRKKAQQEQQRRIAEQEIRKQKSSLPSLPVFDSGVKKDTNPLDGKPKQNSPLDVPKLPPKGNPLGGSTTKSPLGGLTTRSPLGGPLGGSLGSSQKSSGLLSNASLSVPQMPVINKEPSKATTGKKSLFDDDQQDQGFSKKKDMNLPKTSISSQNQKKKASLFGDDDDEGSGFGFGSKTKPKKNTTSKKGLFDEDDDDEGFGFGKKAKKQQVKQSIVQAPIIQVREQPKPAAKKVNLLNKDSDDDDQMFGKKKGQSKEPVKPMLVPPPKPQQDIKPLSVPQQNIKEKSKSKKGLFANSSDSDDGGFGKKKAVKKTSPSPLTATNNLVENKPQPPVVQAKSKKGLFGSSDEEDSPIKQSKPSAVIKQTKPPVTAKQTKSKKGLFGESDDEDDDPFKKKAQKKTEPVKPVANTLQSQPLIPTKKAESLSPSPLTTAKSVNPLGGFSPSPLQPKTSPLSQQSIPQTPKSNPLIGTQQQKKRNIFEESDEDKSPIISTKPKPTQQPQPQQKKKGLISYDSEEQKPATKQQKPISSVSVREDDEDAPKAPQAPAQTSTNNNRRLFDDSQNDSDEEEMIRKKRMANNKLKKLF